MIQDIWQELSVNMTGQRVCLEPLAAEHEDELFEAARPPEIWELTQMQPTGGHGTDDRGAFHEDFRAILRSAVEGIRVPFATRDVSTNTLIGSTSYCNLRPQHRGLEIGWTWLTPSAWGTGANIESKLMLLRHAFEVLGCQRVEFETDALNERSRRALEALPAHFEGVLRDWKLRPDGRRRSSALYSILDNEWPEVARNLRARLAKHGH